MATNATTMTDESITPDDVRDRATALRDGHAADPADSLWVTMVTPRARARVLDALVHAGGEPMTATQLCEAADVGTSSFDRQKDALLDLDVMIEGGMVANARTYRLNREHPVAQLLGMMDSVLRFGTTAMMLGEEFVKTPGVDYEPGEHPADSR